MDCRRSLTPWQRELAQSLQRSQNYFRLTNNRLTG